MATRPGFFVELSGQKEVIAGLRKCGARYMFAYVQAFKAMLLEVEERVRRSIVEQGLQREGELRDSVRARILSLNTSGIEGEVRVSVVYAAIHEFGGIITAKREYLVFQLDDGEWVRTKSVAIPARPYFQPVIESMLPHIDEILVQNMKRFL
jgi:phage gpG-like protein